MECPKCQHENPPQSKFCNECGHDLSQPETPSDTPTKPAEPSAPTGERRQATVLFSDLSGYTAMNEKLDPEEVEGIMSRIKAEAVRIVEGHGGIVSQFVGDEVLALFGIPTAHEDDPHRAVRAALELHELAHTMSPEVEGKIGRTLRMHTGMDTGLVVTSSRDVRDGTVGVTGDTVNTGARLKALAGDDEILLSSDTQLRIAPFFDTEALEPAALKGKAAPLAPFRVRGRTPVESHFEAAEQRGFTTYAGREQELAALHGALEKALAGQGQFVTVSGDAGVGKSRLLYEFRHSLDLERVTVLQGRCQSHGTATPYMPLIDSLRRGLELQDDLSPDERLEKAVANVLAIDPGLEEYLPCYLHLLSISSEEYALPADLSGDALRTRLQESYAAINTKNTARSPTVLILEDWHWADEASDAALRYLLGIISPYRLLVVVLYRPEYEYSWSGLGHETPLPLIPLGTAHTEAIARAVLNTERLPEELGGLIHERTGGNPFFIEEMCQHLLEMGTVLVKNGQAALTRSSDKLELPGTVQAVIRSRLDRLDESHQEVLGVASVIGREFGLRLLERAHPGENPLLPFLEALKIQDVIQQARVLPEVAYLFKHVLTQVVVYETLLLERRKALHGLVGLAIEALHGENLEEQYETLAYHFSISDHHDKALEYLALSAEKAEGLYALVDARRFYNTAITLIDERQRTPALDQRRIDLSLQWAAISAYGVSEELLEALRVSHSRAQEAGDELPLAKLTYWIGMTHYQLGNLREAMPLMEESIRLGEELGNDDLKTLPYNVIGRAFVALAEFGKGIEYLEKGIPLVERIGNQEETAYSTGILGLHYSFIGQFEKGFSLMQKAISLSRAIGNKTREAHSLIYVGVNRAIQGKWEAVLEPLSAGTEIARAVGNPITIGIGVGFEGIALFHMGRRDEGLEQMREGIATIEASGSRQVSPLIASFLAECHALEGHQTEAMNLAHNALEESRAGGQRWAEFGAYRALAMAAALEEPPDWGAVEEQVAAGLALARESGARPLEAMMHLRHAGLLQQKGEVEKASQILQQAAAAFREMGMTGWLEQAEALGEALAAD